MRQGRTFRRCGKCNATVKGRTCGKCGYDGWSWGFVVDVAPPGAKRRQRMRTGFATKAEALEAMAKLQADLARGTAVDPSRITVAEYLTGWLETVRPPTLRPGAWASCEMHVRCYIAPRIGETPLQRLDRPTVKAMYADLRKSGRVRGGGSLSAKTVHNVHLTLHKALADAVDDRLLVRNPADRAHRLPKGGDEVPAWTASELRRFLEWAEEHEPRWHPLWRLASYSGMRRGELLGLHWRELDLDKARVHVIHTRVKGDVGVEDGSPKSNRGRRVIDLDARTIDVLREHQAHQLEERAHFGDKYADLDLVFCRPDGHALHPDVMSQTFNRHVRKVGVPVIPPHGMRHTHATLPLIAGVPLHVVSRRLGHASETFTAQVYAHVLPGQQADAAAMFAALVEDEDDEPHPGD